MILSPELLLVSLGRTTLALAVAVLLTTCLLRLARVTSPTVHRIACALALVVGWSFLQWPVTVPWHQPQSVTALASKSAMSERPADAMSSTPSEIVIELPKVDLDASLEEPMEKALDTPIVAASPATILNPGMPTATAMSANIATWAPRILLAWVAGMLLLAIGWIAGYARFIRKLPKNETADEGWAAQWQALLTTSGIDRAVPFRVTESAGPMLCRLPRGYALFVPATLWRELTPAEREAILRHELAHLERYDVWKSLAVRLLMLPHWFNPCAWWAVRRFDEAAEWACDRVASGAESSTAYARALLRMGEAAGRQASYSPAARSRPLAARIRRLLTTRHRDDSRTKQAVLIAACFGFVAAALVRVDLVAQEATEIGIAEQPTPAVEETIGIANAVADTEPNDGAAPVDHAISPDGSDDTIAPPRHPELLAAAELGYRAAYASLEMGTITLREVCNWSARWLAAEESSERLVGNTPAGEKPRTRKPLLRERIAMVRAHLSRMQKLQARVAELYRVAARGGEAEQLALTNYYVAEAERRLARLVADEQAVEINSAPVEPPAVDDANSTFAWRGLRKPAATLRYEGQSFAQWVKEIDTELSPERRKAAIPALVAFGVNGKGPEATTKLVELLADEELTSTAMRALGRMGRAAADALPTLEELAKSPDHERAAEVAMARIRGERVEEPSARQTLARRLQAMREMHQQKNDALNNERKHFETLQKSLNFTEPATMANLLQQQLAAVNNAILTGTSQLPSLQAELEQLKVAYTLSRDPDAKAVHLQELYEKDQKLRNLDDQRDLLELALEESRSSRRDADSPDLKLLEQRYSNLRKRIDLRRAEIKNAAGESSSLKVKESEAKIRAARDHCDKAIENLKNLKIQQQELLAKVSELAKGASELERSRDKIVALQEVVDKLNDEIQKIQIEKQNLDESFDPREVKIDSAPQPATYKANDKDTEGAATPAQ